MGLLRKDENGDQWTRRVAINALWIVGRKRRQEKKKKGKKVEAWMLT